MTIYIRGKRQIEALFIFLEAVWLAVIGRDTRDLDAWDLKYCVYSGKEFSENKLKCAKRELEIFLGFAKPYAIYTTPEFNKQYSELCGDAALVEFLYKQELENEKIVEAKDAQEKTK